jgi:hypothetical protein
VKWSAAAPALFLLAACDPGDVVLLAPETSDGAPTLSIHAVIDTPYNALAESLGWSAGVPGAQVRIHLMADPYDSSYWHVVTTDSLGRAAFSAIGGPYEVEVSRTLTSAEAARSGDTVQVLAGGGRLYASRNGATDMAVVPDRRGSLIFSEFGVATPPVSGYEDATYFEIYNNSDTSIYLDGKFWGIGWDLNYDFPYWRCAETAQIRDDPQGIWTRIVERFPGRGHDYPLLPGHEALIARSAIDHRSVETGLYDLRQADFEWGPPATPDNPDVPNLQDIGPSLIGYATVGGAGPSFLSEPVDLATLPRYVDPHSATVYVRIPRALILDASASVIDWTAQSYVQYPPCLQVANSAFERLPGPADEYYSDFAERLSYQRRFFLVLPEGRKLLQDTHTSMFDFVKAPRTPGWIPDSLPEQP